MSKKIIRLTTKGTTTNPVPPPLPKGIITDVTDESEQDNVQSLN